MRWNLENILGGAASVQLFAPGQDYRTVLAKVELRAKQESVPASLALRRFMQERLLGQVLMTTGCLSLLTAALVGATQGWPEPLVVLAGSGPGLLMLAAAASQATKAKKHK